MSHATSVGNKRKQTEDRIFFVLSNIVSIVSYPSKKTDQNEVNAIKDLLQCIRSSPYCQKNGFYKTWTFDFSSPQQRGEMVCQNIHFMNKKVSKALRKKPVERIMKNSIVHEAPIARDTLLITYAESIVKQRVKHQMTRCQMIGFR